MQLARAALLAVLLSVSLLAQQQQQGPDLKTVQAAQQLAQQLKLLDELAEGADCRAQSYRFQRQLADGTLVRKADLVKILEPQLQERGLALDANFKVVTAK